MATADLAQAEAPGGANARYPMQSFTNDPGWRMTPIPEAGGGLARFSAPGSYSSQGRMTSISEVQEAPRTIYDEFIDVNAEKDVAANFSKFNRANGDVSCAEGIAALIRRIGAVKSIRTVTIVGFDPLKFNRGDPVGHLAMAAGDLLNLAFALRQHCRTLENIAFYDVLFDTGAVLKFSDFLGALCVGHKVRVVVDRATFFDREANKLAEGMTVLQCIQRFYATMREFQLPDSYATAVMPLGNVVFGGSA